MKQLFPEGADTIFQLVCIAIIFGLIAFFPVRSFIENSSYMTYVGVFQNQDVPFSHAHHVGDMKFDCRYCHTSAEKSHFAGIPSGNVCFGCHSQLWNQAELLAPVRNSLETGTPLVWWRVNNLPDYVYFNHSIHVSKGMGCATCHGRVDLMPLTRKTKAWHMMDCLDCHRHPEEFIRPKDKVYDPWWKPPANQHEEGLKLLKEYNVRTDGILNCTTCHR